MQILCILLLSKYGHYLQSNYCCSVGRCWFILHIQTNQLASLYEICSPWDKGFSSAFVWQNFFNNSRILPKLFHLGQSALCQVGSFSSCQNVREFSREILNIVFMSVAVLHSGDLTLVSETAAFHKPWPREPWTDCCAWPSSHEHDFHSRT